MRAPARACVAAERPRGSRRCSCRLGSQNWHKRSSRGSCSTGTRRNTSLSVGRHDPDDVYDLFYWANKIRIRFIGPDVKFCAIVAAKAGGCSEDCKFCAQSAHYDAPAKEQSKLTDEQVLDSAWHAAEVGADSFGIVNSGRGPTRAELEDWLKPIMMKIAREGKTRACATLRRLTPETARFLYDCGIRRINHNLETSERHYPNIVSTHPFSERLNTLARRQGSGPLAVQRRDLRDGRGVGRTGST